MPSKITYFDCETTGLNPKRDRITLAQFLIDGELLLLQDPSKEEIHAILDNTDLIVGHNLPFDFGFAGYIPKSIDHFDDTLYLDRLVNYKHKSHSLDEVAKRIYGYDPYEKEGLDKKAMQKTDWAKADLTKDQIKYASMDVEILPKIYATLLHQKDHGVYRFDKQSIMDALHIQRIGLPIRQDKVEEEILHTQTELDENPLPFNVNSPKQVREALGAESTNDRVLAELEAHGDVTAAKVRKRRKALKYLNFLNKLGEHPRYYGTLAPAARSGRFTSKQENIQNIPRAQKKFVGTDTLTVIVAADFAQLELRTIAAITGDDTMLALFKSGEDLHAYTAEQLFGPDYTKDQRQIAKVFNFGTLYGAGAATIRTILLQWTGIVMEESEVQRLKRKWLDTFTGIARWHRRGGARMNGTACYRTPHGRPYKAERYTDMLSIENQGAGAEVARIALHQIVKNLPPEALLFNFVHDSYVVECPNTTDLYKESATVVRDAMYYAWETAPFEKHGLTMPVDVGVAYNWKDADALENCIYTLGDGE